MPVEESQPSTVQPEVGATPAPEPEVRDPGGEGTPAVDASPEPDLVVDDVGNATEVEKPWTGEDWAGDLDGVPEAHRDVAKVIIDRFSATILENEQIIDALERALDSTGDDPRLEQLRKDLEARNSELDTQRAQYEEANGKLTTLQSEYDTKAAEWNGHIEAREAEDLSRFARENPKLVDEKSKEYARLQEILEDEGEEDLWDFWELPELVDLKKADYNKVKKLRQEGVPTRYAIQLVGSERAQKQDNTLPESAIAGAGGAGSRTPAPRSVKEAPNLKAKLELIAENAILKSKAR